MWTAATTLPSGRDIVLPWVKTRHLLALSGLIHLGLLLYAQHVDTHPERYGGLKYTDVDWRVVVDGARHIWQPGGKNGSLAAGHAAGAAGVFGRWPAERGWNVGDPYNRATFRYTPLLPLILSPALLHDLLGKLVLSAISLAVPLALLSRRPMSTLPQTIQTSAQRRHDDRSPYFWPVHLLWTLNPFVLNITTRGSPEAIIVLMVVACFAHLRRYSSIATAAAKSDSKSSDLAAEAGAAVLFALAVSFKIYPVIYTPTIWAVLRRRHWLLGWGVWRFGLIAAVALGTINGVLWLVWGQPFLQHTFLYHLSRIDHRHNFSPYFYSMYLSIFSPSPPASTVFLQSGHSVIYKLLDPLVRLIRHPLIAFVPQSTLVLALGWTLEPLLGLERTAFLQTAAFVVFNKVCTSQYFVWFIPLLPALIAEASDPVDTERPLAPSGHAPPEEASVAPRHTSMRMSRRKAVGLVSAWILGQAAWLGSAYRLELLALDAYLQVWAAGILLFGISVYILGELLESVDARQLTVRVKVE